MAKPISFVYLLPNKEFLNCPISGSNHKAAIMSFNMGNHRISPQVKELALELWIKGFSRSDVCEIFQVSAWSLYCWHKLSDNFNSVTPPPSPLCVVFEGLVWSNFSHLGIKLEPQLVYSNSNITNDWASDDAQPRHPNKYHKNVMKGITQVRGRLKGGTKYHQNQPKG